VLVDPSSEDALAVVDEETDGWGVDVAIECSGATTAMEDAVEAIQANTRFESGTVISVGVQSEPLCAEYYGIREGNLTVSGDHTRFDLHQILRLLAAGEVDLDHSITHRISPYEIEDGVELLKGADERVGRVVVDMTELE
jgi:threonine dehydrogenase-like Zn-dependent dehydrogenase